ncbi:MAG: hypothetical protein JXB32_22450 [Deltaproteobacteria bacterium]|nr:hypothetical protein [Deltaproteobacteria bacterium]
MGPRPSRLRLLLAGLAWLAGCGLETGGTDGSDVVEVRDEGFEGGEVDVVDAPTDRDDGPAEDGTSDEVEEDADAADLPDAAETEDAGEADGEPETVEDVGPGEAVDEGPDDAPPACPIGFTWCGDACVDTSSDPLHCGGCGHVCDAPPHTTAFCSAGACGVVCEVGWADCNADAADGCEADLASSVAHCGECGHACDAPPNADPRCMAGVCGFACRPGFVELGPRCAAFGGAHLRAECRGETCRNPNPFTGDCSCPPGFVGSSTFRIVNDCTDPTYVWADLRFCSAPSLAAGSDWGGAYHLHDSGLCAVGNPYTGRCTCPAGFVPISWRVETADFRWSSVGLCWSPSATEVTFAGAFEVGDVGSPCLVSNPETGGCSCPADAMRVDYRGIFAHGSPWGNWGTQMPICYR